LFVGLTVSTRQMGIFNASISICTSAYHRVKENRGSAVVDGISIEEFERNLERNLDRLRKEILDKTYFPLPLLKILVDKGNGESRAWLIPNMSPVVTTKLSRQSEIDLRSISTQVRAFKIKGVLLIM